MYICLFACLVTVTYMEGQPMPFRGVLLQARVVADDSAVGTFTVVDDNTQIRTGCAPEGVCPIHM